MRVLQPLQLRLRVAILIQPCAVPRVCARSELVGRLVELRIHLGVGHGHAEAIRIELVGDRFLRRQVKSAR